MRLYNLMILAALLTSCTGGKVRITGQFSGYGNETAYLEQILPGGQKIVDSAKLDNKGKLNFTVLQPEKNPVVYNLHIRNESITILARPGEKIKISSIGDLARNYKVSGSLESELLKTFKTSMATGAFRLDSLLNLHAESRDEQRQSIVSEYSEVYRTTKREQLKFIASYPGSMAALYALYQRLPYDQYLYSEDNDHIYYKLVADSVSESYPGSPYLKALKNDLRATENLHGMTMFLNDRLNSQPEGYPDITLPDIYGKPRRLSDLEGNIIILDFWSLSSTRANINNAEYRELYSEMYEKGLRIYQISVDELRSEWTRTVQEQKLPWVTVNDFRGSASIPVLVYNVKKIPSNYIIDREGNIVGKDMYGERLEQFIKQLLK